MDCNNFANSHLLSQHMDLVYKKENATGVESAFGTKKRIIDYLVWLTNMLDMVTGLPFGGPVVISTLPSLPV